MIRAINNGIKSDAISLPVFRVGSGVPVFELRLFHVIDCVDYLLQFRGPAVRIAGIEQLLMASVTRQNGEHAFRW